ncbi:MAG: trigger factor [Bacillota bacterium]|nr:trigger factor [Bacillota bacterium]
MLKSKENIENSKVKLEIEVAAPDVDTALAKAYRKVVKKVNLPGFRKGKIPRRILESRFGPEILHEEALELLVPSAYDKALEEADIDPINHPDFELVQIEGGKPLIFHAVVEVLPPVEVGEYKGLKAEQEEVELDEMQIEHHLFMLREQNARLVPREEGPVKEGDIVMIDFKGYVDGEPFEGGEAENYSLEIGSKSFIPGFEEQLIGAHPEEDIEVKLKFPDNYRKEDVAGKDAIFKVKVNQIKEKELPELDDEFVKEVSEFETIEDMKADLRVKMLKNAEDQSLSKLEEELIEKVASSSAVETPKVLVDRQIDRMLGDLESYLRYQGMGLDQFIEMSGKTREELREDRREEAEQRAKANLVLDAIAKKEGITVEDSEIEAKIAEIAESYNDDPERIRDILEKQGRIPVMMEEIRIRKVIDLLVGNAEIKKVKPNKPEKDSKPKKAKSAKAPDSKAEPKEAKKAKTTAKPKKTAAAKTEDKEKKQEKKGNKDS